MSHRLTAIADAVGVSVPNAFRSKMPTTALGIANHQITVNGAVCVILSYGANTDRISAANAKYAPIRRFLASATTPASDSIMRVVKYATEIRYTSEGTNGGVLTIAGPSLAPIS